MRSKIIAGIVLVPLTVLALAACGESAAPVSQKSDKDSGSTVVKEAAESAPDTSSDEATEAAADTGSEDLATDEATDTGSEDLATDEATDTGSEDLATDEVTDTAADAGTASLGDTVEVGDWSVTVTKVVKNASDLIHQTNEFNDLPKGQYVLVTYEATYNGAERTADVQMDTTWTFTDNASKIHNVADAVAPSDDQEWPYEARTGGTVKQQVTFDLQPGAIEGGILSVEGYDANFDTVFADFAV